MGIALRSEPGNLVLNPIKTYENYITCIVNAWLRASTEKHIQTDDWKRTCSIHVILSAIDFNADKAKIEDAIKEGEKAMVAFLSKLSQPSLDDIIREKDAKLEKITNKLRELGLLELLDSL